MRHRIDHDCRIPVTAQQRKIVDAHHLGNHPLRQGDAKQYTHCGMSGQSHRQPCQQPGAGPARKLSHHRPHLAGQPRRAALVAFQNPGDLLAKVLRQPIVGQSRRRTCTRTITGRPSSGTSVTARQ
jgi:hypothetical protein